MSCHRGKRTTMISLSLSLSLMKERKWKWKWSKNSKKEDEFKSCTILGRQHRQERKEGGVLSVFRVLGGVWCSQRLQVSGSPDHPTHSFTCSPPSSPPPPPRLSDRMPLSERQTDAPINQHTLVNTSPTPQTPTTTAHTLTHTHTRARARVPTRAYAIERAYVLCGVELQCVHALCW